MSYVESYKKLLNNRNISYDDIVFNLNQLKKLMGGRKITRSDYIHCIQITLIQMLRSSKLKNNFSKFLDYIVDSGYVNEVLNSDVINSNIGTPLACVLRSKTPTEEEVVKCLSLASSNGRPLNCRIFDNKFIQDSNIVKSVRLVNNLNKELIKLINERNKLKWGSKKNEKEITKKNEEIEELFYKIDEVKKEIEEQKVKVQYIDIYQNIPNKLSYLANNGDWKNVHSGLQNAVEINPNYLKSANFHNLNGEQTGSTLLDGISESAANALVRTRNYNNEDLIEINNLLLRLTTDKESYRKSILNKINRSNLRPEQKQAILSNLNLTNTNTNEKTSEKLNRKNNLSIKISDSSSDFDELLSENEKTNNGKTKNVYHG